MEFKAVMDNHKRMCDYFQHGKGHCNKCPLSIDNNNLGKLCKDLVFNYPSEAEQIIVKWTKEHPAKTIKDDFLEKHPNALLCKDGTPVSCAKFCGYCTKCIAENGASNCTSCWNQPMDD